MKITVFYKIFSFLLSLFTTLAIGVIPAPSTDDPITLPENSYVNFVLWGDPQVSNLMYSRARYLDAACEDVKNSGITFDALIIAGDIAENGLEDEYVKAAKSLEKTSADVYLIAEGNHDIRNRIYSQTKERFLGFVNGVNVASGNDYVVDSMHFSYEVNGIKFIVMGSDKTVFEESYFSDEQLAWLDSEIASAQNGKPVFVINHQPLKLTHGLPDTWGSPIDSAGSVGDQSDEIFEIMNKYENVIFVTGHLHTALGEYLYEEKGNVKLVNVPSVGITSKDGIYNEAGTGFVVSVTDDEIIFAARDFASGCYVPDGDIVISLAK